MYRLMIVDDEPEIREGLRLKIDAEALGLEWAGEAANGIEALDRLEDELIDIVVTDMNMPVMDGVTFLAACRERYPEVRVVVITGYEDFGYARAALRNQASDYLLKPVARDELNGVLSKLIAEMDAERKKREQEAKNRWELTQYYHEMKEHFVLRLVKGDLEREQAVLDSAGRFGFETWAEREVRFLTAGFRERDIPAEESDAEGAATGRPERFRLPFDRICRRLAAAAGSSCEAFHDPNYPGLMHFVTREDEAWLQTFADELREQARAALGFGPTTGASRGVAGFRQWKEGYLASLLAWNLSESGPEADDRRTPSGQEPTEEEIAATFRHLAKGETAAFDRAVRRLLQEALSASPARFVKVIFQVYLQLESAANERRIRLNSSEQLWLRPEMALALDTVDKAGAFLGGIARRIDSQRKAEADEGEHSLIENAKQYILDNYMSDLNLTQIAERFNYNASYFSELFKNKVGKTFIQFLTEARMAQAVRLLEGTQLSLWDISELTGFSNASYFSSKFKRLYGMSPSDYRQQAAGRSKA